MLISSLRIAMRLSRCPGIPGAGCWDGIRKFQAGPRPADSGAPDSVFENDRVISLERR